MITLDQIEKNQKGRIVEIDSARLAFLKSELLELPVLIFVCMSFRRRKILNSR